ncbi:MAG: diguanylate cyclase [Proteobacteria bacterium]|nr:diguanylate cyclase [Pseudomonadota bacterium]
MNICIPIDEDKGLQSPVCAHFGAAPLFMIVNTDNEDLEVIDNKNTAHGHGMCQPLASLSGRDLDGVVVRGIGMGALMKLQSSNIQVFRSKFSTVDETIAALKAGTLQKATSGITCAHHHGQGSSKGKHTCAHHGHGPSKGQHTCGQHGKGPSKGKHTCRHHGSQGESKQHSCKIKLDELQYS